MSNVNNNQLQKTLTHEQFSKLLEQTQLSVEQKKCAISIFNNIAGNDGELNTDEWNVFIREVDNDGDNKLTNEEITAATQKQGGSLFNLNKDDIANFYNAVTSFIKRIENSEVEESIAEVKTHPPTANKYRLKSITYGNFCDNWIESDKYNSKTFDEWLKNNGYEMNYSVSNELYEEAKSRDKGHYMIKRQCAMAIRESMQDTTAVSKQEFFDLKQQYSEDSDNEYKSNKLFNGMKSQLYAYQYGSELSNNPYFREVPHNIVATTDLKTLPKGCVIVYDANYITTKGKNGIDYHRKGHIAVTDGTGMDSGGGHYNIQDGKQSTHIRVFIPIKVN